jgi:DNA-binding XRE family transcriptional regulator
MLVAVKKRRTEGGFQVSGDVPEWLLAELKKRYKSAVKLVAQEGGDEESIPIEEGEWYRAARTRRTPGRSLRLLRLNRGLSQAALANQLGPTFNKQRVSQMENGHRGISKTVARKLAEILQTSVANLV